jgi:hypothetical protein
LSVSCRASFPLGVREGATTNFVVRHLHRSGELTPDFIGEESNMPVPRVNSILEKLEKHLTFLFKNPEDAVTSAYPVTVNKTPIRVQALRQTCGHRAGQRIRDTLKEYEKHGANFYLCSRTT